MLAFGVCSTVTLSSSLTTCSLSLSSFASYHLVTLVTLALQKQPTNNSTVIHERGSPETLRDPRGFAVKFYTREGNFDMVGNNIPVGWLVVVVVTTVSSVSAGFPRV